MVDEEFSCDLYKYFSFRGMYLGVDDNKYFSGEFDLFSDFSVFSIFQHDFNGLLEIPLKGFFDSRVGVNGLYLHDDINDDSELGLSFYLKVSKGLIGKFSGFAFFNDADINYTGLLKILYSENNYLGVVKDFSIKGSVSVPVSGTIDKLF
ncbi:hypothetical protein K9L97_02895 [Candidatus Woesearchaeota archaeon]|nr:hypothetical protein [Candidatus Woesearchaeota archaeon]